MTDSDVVDVGSGAGPRPPFPPQQETRSRDLAHPDDGDAVIQGRRGELTPVDGLVVEVARVEFEDGVGERHKLNKKTLLHM